MTRVTPSPGISGLRRKSFRRLWQFIFVPLSTGNLLCSGQFCANHCLVTLLNIDAAFDINYSGTPM